MEQARPIQGRFFMDIDALLAARLSFPFVLDLCVRHGLPLHIGRSVCAATCQWLDVVYDVTLAGACRFAGSRTPMLMLECSDGK